LTSDVRLHIEVAAYRQAVFAKQEQAMSNFPIVDPHQHLWDLTHHRYPWLTDKPSPIRVAGPVEPLARDYLLPDYLTDTASQNVVMSVHIDAGFDAADPIAETRWLQSIADQHGYPHGIVGHAKLETPDVERVLEQHSAFANIRGIRQIVNWHPDPDKSYVARPDMLTDPAWRRGFALLRKYGLSFDLQLYPEQMHDAARLAADNPDTLIVVNHAGMPVDKSPDGIALWRRGMRELAARPNVRVKVSGLGMLDWNWAVDSIRPFVLESIDIFGTDRAMFASNWPVDSLYSSFDALYAAFREIVSGFTEAEQQRLFHDNAIATYRLIPRP